jgi:predicted protein tyrosine phosphatase
MGYGAYSYEAHDALTTARQTQPTQQVFAQRACHPLMDPNGVVLRESRDSPEHPESLAIAFALDVTGSMGRVPERLARHDLPGLMKTLRGLGIADPQILFLAIGDALGDRAPLQVGQFESTAELMDQWLTWTWIEGGGGGGDRESYELALYFLARHVDMDCHRKRGQRGYLFLTGDEKPYSHVSKRLVKQWIGADLDVDLPLAAVVEEVQHAFEPFFLIPDLERRRACERVWRDVLGDRVICLESPDDTCTVAASLLALGQGLRTLDEIASGLREGGMEPRRVGRIARALMPYAASLGRDGAPRPKLEPEAALPDEAGGASELRRVT